MKHSSLHLGYKIGNVIYSTFSRFFPPHSVPHILQLYTLKNNIPTEISNSSLQQQTMYRLSEKETTHPLSATHKPAVQDHDSTTLLNNSTKPSNPPIKSFAKAIHSKIGDFWKHTWLGKATEQYKTVVTNKLVYLQEFKCFLPYIWPSSEPKLFFNYAGVGICLLATRVLFVLVPVQLGAIINALGSSDKGFPYSEIALYMLYRWLVNSGLSSLRQYLWEAVDRWSSHAVSSAAYNHVIRLSSDYHDSKSSAKLNSTLWYVYLGLSLPLLEYLQRSHTDLKLLFQSLP